MAENKFLQVPHKTPLAYEVSVSKAGTLWLLVHKDTRLEDFKGWEKTELKVRTNFGSLIVLQREGKAGDRYKMPEDEWISPVVVASEITMKK